MIREVSDHEIVFAEIDINPVQNRQQARKIPLYYLNTLKKEIPKSFSGISASDSGVNELWNLFKFSLERNVSIHIPYKIAKVKYSLPWISKALKKTNSSTGQIKQNYEKIDKC